MPQIGYISSFLESEGLGFVRGADDPRRLLLFHRAAVADELADNVALVGLEVVFETSPAAGPGERRPMVSSVRPHVPPPDTEVTPAGNG